VVGYSCKGRAFCPSCMGRRMVDTAAHLVDRVFPRVPIRQWVLSFPWAVRFQLARDSKLLSRAIAIFLQEVFRHYERELLYARHDLDPDLWRHRRSLPYEAEMVGGAVTSVQRFGSSLNLNSHLHTLALDGVYFRDPKTQRVLFFEAPRPTKEALQEVVDRVARRVTRLLVRRGLLSEGSREEGGLLPVEPADPTALDVVQGASIRGMAGLAGKHKRTEVEGRDKDAPWVSPGEKPFTAEEEGYTIHAGVELDGKNREKLEKVCRYLFRPAFAEERLLLRPDGKVEYGFRKPRWDGGRRVVLEPLELLEKLAALVPPPRAHLTRYSGILAPSHEWRKAVVPAAPEGESGECTRRPPFEPWDEEEDERPRRRRNPAREKAMDWASRILRSLKLDVLSCPRCGGRMKVIATISEPFTVRKILRSMGLSTEIPPRAPPRASPPGEFEFAQ